MTEEEFGADEMVQDAVVRNLGIIGEAARHVPSDIQERYSGIPWAQMRGMRNVLIHEYPEVNSSIVWRTVTRNLPSLPSKLKEILEREQ